MIIDNKGKLFGKINIIDLLIVIVIAAAVLLVAFKTVLPIGGSGSSVSETIAKENVDVYFEFFAEEVPDYVVDGTMNVGDIVTEVGTDNVMGEIVEGSDGVIMC